MPAPASDHYTVLPAKRVWKGSLSKGPKDWGEQEDLVSQWLFEVLVEMSRIREGGFLKPWWSGVTWLAVRGSWFFFFLIYFLFIFIHGVQVQFCHIDVLYCGELRAFGAGRPKLSLEHCTLYLPSNLSSSIPLLPPHPSQSPLSIIAHSASMCRHYLAPSHTWEHTVFVFLCLNFHLI